MGDVSGSRIWSYFNPVRVKAGAGVLSSLADLHSDDKKKLLVTSRGFTRRGVTDRVLALLGSERVAVFDGIGPNPDIDELSRITEKFKSEKISSIIAVGGGSVLDTAKVLGTTLSDGQEKNLDQMLRHGETYSTVKCLPVTAVPTTSGTGAEVTPFATVWDELNKKKYSLSGDHLFPENCLLDPELTLTLPREETLFTALDAVSHALESLWNKNRNVVSESFALEALSLCVKSLPVVLEHPDNLNERTSMQQASFLAGLAISQTRTAIAHAISYPLTIHYGVPHGLACSFTLPNLIRKYENTLSEGRELNLLREVQKLIDAIDPRKFVKRYFNQDEMLRLVDEMFHPERAGNYVFNVDAMDIMEILKVETD